MSANNSYGVIRFHFFAKPLLITAQYVPAVRVVKIYRYDGITRYKHVRLSYGVHLLIYGIWRK